MLCISFPHELNCDVRTSTLSYERYRTGSACVFQFQEHANKFPGDLIEYLVCIIVSFSHALVPGKAWRNSRRRIPLSGCPTPQERRKSHQSISKYHHHLHLRILSAFLRRLRFHYALRLQLRPQALPHRIAHAVIRPTARSPSTHPSERAAPAVLEFKGISGSMKQLLSRSYRSSVAFALRPLPKS